MTAVAKILSAASLGFEGHLIEVESDATKGLPSLQIVGLGNKAIDEATERVKSAVANSLLEFPAKRITINLAPAELPKDGTHYDLPIALAILVSSGQLHKQELTNAAFAGELALDSSLRPVRDAITLAETANDAQASLVSGIHVIGLDSLKSLFLHLKKEVSRANSHVEYPADFILVGTVNPCPCGYYGDATRECSCAATQIMAYQKRLSGPMLDRIDLIVSVSRVPNDTLLTTNLQTNIQQLAAKSIITIATENNLTDTRVVRNTTIISQTAILKQS